jgi:glutamate synthase (NADPH/NADH) large chain
MVDLVGVESAEDQKLVRVLLQRHAMVTGSQRAKHILDHWDAYRGKFVKVFPREYRRALEECHATAVTAETVLDLLPA